MAAARWAGRAKFVAIAALAVAGCTSFLLGSNRLFIGSPAPRLGTVSTAGQSPSGRVIAIGASVDGRRVYAGTLRGGVWRSDDSGYTWRQLTRPQPGDAPLACAPPAASPCNLPMSAITDIAVWPRDPDLLFVGTALDQRRTPRHAVYR